MALRERLNRLRDRLRRDELDAELAEELRHHRELLERDRLDGAQLGNATSIREETRAMWSLGWFDDLLLDARRWADRVHLVQGERRLTFADVDAASARVAGALREHGVTVGAGMINSGR